MSKMKLWGAVVLVALCLSIAGTAWAQDSWNPTAETLPAGLAWDQGANVSITAENDGALGPPPATWDTTYSIVSVEGATATAVAIDRWGVTEIAVAGPVPPTDDDLPGMYTWDFTVTAPPIATITYNLPLTATSVAVASALDCNWAFAKDDVLFTDLPTVVNPITISRFTDIGPGSAGAWAAWYIQECAGRMPPIVGGYPNGTYGPALQVTRDQMAVFVQRAINLPLGTYAGAFSDVPIGYWADDQIQSCVDAGIVGGYAGGTYRPTLVVNRDAMAVFVARGLAGGDSAVPSGPPTASFSDVPTAYWAYKYIEYAVDHNVVGGYPGGTYRPTNPVDRGQMTVFMYRAAIQPSGAVVVLAGPGVTAVDPGAASYEGWSTATVGEAADPGFAYIAIDAVRAPSADTDVTFELRDAATPTTVATGDYTTDVTVTAAEIDTAKSAAESDGVPYLYVVWDISAGLAEGEYLLVVTVSGTELTRQPAFTIGTPPPPAEPEEVVLHPTSLATDEGTLTSGAVGDLAADDNNYVVWAAGATGRVGAHYTFDTTLTAADILKVKVELTYKASDPDPVPVNLMTSGATGGTRYCDTAPALTTTEQTFVWETANTAKIADMFQTAGEFDVIFCSCDEVPAYSFDLSMDEVKVTFTLK